jgi:ABC-type transporter Mla MlaB component
MTCRIQRFVIEEEHVILCISGRIREQDVDTLRACLEQERDAVAIDLKDILLVDSEAVRFLASLESTGTELRNCPAYIREWIRRERASGDASDRGKEAREDPADV